MGFYSASQLVQDAKHHQAHWQAAAIEPFSALLDQKLSVQAHGPTADDLLTPAPSLAKEVMEITPPRD